MRYTPVMASSALFVALVGIAAAQRFTPRTPPLSQKATTTARMMARYENALECLERGKVEQALQALTPDPDEVLLLPVELPEPDLRKGERLPQGTFLFLGAMLSNKAKQAAEQGALELSQSLLEACQDLSRRLSRDNHHETLAERNLRRSVAARLEVYARRAAQELGQSA